MKVYERIHEVKSGKVCIRMWCAATEGFLDATEASSQKEAIWRVLSTLGAVSGLESLGSMIPEQVAAALATLKFCNAVEVRMGDSGVLIYPDWP